LRGAFDTTSTIVKGIKLYHTSDGCMVLHNVTIK
jgi:hypothetical protein